MRLTVSQLRRIIKEEVSRVMVEFGDRSEPSEYLDVEGALRAMFRGAGGLLRGGVAGVSGGTYEYVAPADGDAAAGQSDWKYVGRVRLNLKLDPAGYEFSGPEDVIEMLQEIPDVLSDGGSRFKFEGFVEPEMSADGGSFTVEFEVAEEPRRRR
jgi:hypothetical protein